MYNRTTKLRLIEYKVTIFCDFNYNTFKICLSYCPFLKIRGFVYLLIQVYSIYENG